MKKLEQNMPKTMDDVVNDLEKRVATLEKTVWTVSGAALVAAVWFGATALYTLPNAIDKAFEGTTLKEAAGKIDGLLKKAEEDSQAIKTFAQNGGPISALQLLLKRQIIVGHWDGHKLTGVTRGARITAAQDILGGDVKVLRIDFSELGFKSPPVILSSMMRDVNASLTDSPGLDRTKQALILSQRYGNGGTLNGGFVPEAEFWFAIIPPDD